MEGYTWRNGLGVGGGNKAAGQAGVDRVSLVY